MTRKELGYVELEWTCPRCNTRNPGAQTTCEGCGAPQPQDVQFNTPVAGDLVQDEAKLARAQSAPDIQCAYCGTRNPADAQSCKQCGADLGEGKQREAGQVLGAFQQQAAPPVRCATCGAENPASNTRCQQCGAPLARPKPVAPAKTATRPAAAAPRQSWVAWLVIALVFGGLIWLVMLSTRTTEMVGTVREARWTRSIPIEGLVPVERNGWHDEVPADANLLSCRPEVRFVQDTPTANSREVCGTPYTIDTGTGFGQVVQDCRYEVYEDRCQYTVDEWRVIDVLESKGNGFAPTWPVAALQPRQRLGSGRERYECIISSNDRLFTYVAPSLAAYEDCQPGTPWSLEVNGLGGLTSLQPLP
jgi:ribosomal protein L40E